MSDPLNRTVLLNASNDIKKLSAWFAGLAAVGPELAKIASIEGSISEAQTRLAAVRADEDATKARIAQETQAVIDAANAEATTIRATTQQQAQTARDTARADADAIVREAQGVRDAAVSEVISRHAKAAEEIAAKHEAADKAIADKHAAATRKTSADVVEATAQLAGLKSEIAKLLATPLADQMRKMLPP